MPYLLCSNCFTDHGLRLDAERLGEVNHSSCKHCGSLVGKKLTEEVLEDLVYRFFVHGSAYRGRFGAAHQVQVNRSHKTEINPPPWLALDVHLLERTQGLGFFYYAPRLWMLGEIEPLKRLARKATRDAVFDEIIDKYPVRHLQSTERFYRVRKAPKNPETYGEYDSAPLAQTGKGRLDAKSSQVMYASPDLQVCLHECRVAAEDTLYAATLRPKTRLRLLDLTVHPKEDDVSQFESLGMALHMLFLAPKHSYAITRALATRLAATGLDGLVYPSYFSILRTGHLPWEAARAEPPNRLLALDSAQHTDMVQNLAIFGSPIADGRVQLECINRLILNRVQYDVSFGPANV